jgi:hypothetical protein
MSATTMRHDRAAATAKRHARVGHAPRMRRDGGPKPKDAESRSIMGRSSYHGAGAVGKLHIGIAQAKIRLCS